MKTDKFLKVVDGVLDKLKSDSTKEGFSENMKRLGIDERSFSEWMMTYLAWNELGSEEDCKEFYWHYEEEG